MEQSLQDRYAPGIGCFGCGPKNDQGLRIKSHVRGDEVVAEFRPSPHHQAFPGMVCGGIIGTLFDCHSNWTAAQHLMTRAGADAPPCTVTSEFHVKLRRPTALGGTLTLRAHVVASDERRATVECTLETGGEVTATCTGEFVAVKPGHPAYHRW